VVSAARASAKTVLLKNVYRYVCYICNSISIFPTMSYYDYNIVNIPNTAFKWVEAVNNSVKTHEDQGKRVFNFNSLFIYFSTNIYHVLMPLIQL
jgi:hypothetical protein